MMKERFTINEGRRVVVKFEHRPEIVDVSNAITLRRRSGRNAINLVADDGTFGLHG